MNNIVTIDTYEDMKKYNLFDLYQYILNLKYDNIKIKNENIELNNKLNLLFDFWLEQ